MDFSPQLDFESFFGFLCEELVFNLSFLLLAFDMKDFGEEGIDSDGATSRRDGDFEEAFAGELCLLLPDAARSWLFERFSGLGEDLADDDETF